MVEYTYHKEDDVPKCGTCAYSVQDGNGRLFCHNSAVFTCEDDVTNREACIAYIHWDDFQVLQNAKLTPHDDFDAVKPSYYNKHNFSCFDAIEAATSNLTGIEAYQTGIAIKYLWRWKEKNGIEDLAKAKNTIEELIKFVDK